ncbi:MAG: nitronate monooxygenase family protein [Pseudomonadota bacterium]
MNANSSLARLLRNVRLPVIAAPMFTVSYPRLVSAQCKAGIIGSFPAMNARSPELLENWLSNLKKELDEAAAETGITPAPFAVNLIVNDSNLRLAQDMRTCTDQQVPIFITSLRAPPRELIDAAHAYGGLVLHDVISLRHAEKALDAGVDGLILVAAGAGGHAGALSPFALLNEVRRIFDGPIALSGAISSGSDVLAAQAMGADFAYIGTRFIATAEAEAVPQYKETLLAAAARDILYTDFFTGVHGNYLRPSIIAAGLDPDKLNKPEEKKGYFGPSSDKDRPKNWKDIWGAGQGVGSIDDIPTVAALIDRMVGEYGEAARRVAMQAARHANNYQTITTEETS